MNYHIIKVSQIVFLQQNKKHHEINKMEHKKSITRNRTQKPRSYKILFRLAINAYQNENFKVCIFRFIDKATNPKSKLKHNFNNINRKQSIKIHQIETQRNC